MVFVCVDFGSVWYLPTFFNSICHFASKIGPRSCNLILLHYWTKVLEIKIWVNDSGPLCLARRPFKLGNFPRKLDSHSESIIIIIVIIIIIILPEDDEVMIQSWRAPAQTQFPWGAKSQCQERWQGSGLWQNPNNKIVTKSIWSRHRRWEWKKEKVCFAT